MLETSLGPDDPTQHSPKGVTVSFPIKGPSFGPWAPTPGWGVRAPHPHPRFDSGPEVSIHNSHITGTWKHDAPIVQEIQVDNQRHSIHSLTDVDGLGNVGKSFFGD